MGACVNTCTEIINNLYNNSSYLTYKGVVSSEDDLQRLNDNTVGDVYTVSTGSGIYLYTGSSKWEHVENYIADIEHKDQELKVENIKCKNCFAPIKIEGHRNSQFKCEYCGSTYRLY